MGTKVLQFRSIDTEKAAPTPWKAFVDGLHPNVTIVAEKALEAVLRGCGISGRIIAREYEDVPLLVPDDQGRPTRNPDIRYTGDRELLSFGAATLVLAQGVSQLLRHPNAFDAGGHIKRLRVKQEPNNRQTTCAEILDSAGMHVDRFSAHTHSVEVLSQGEMRVSAHLLKDGPPEYHSLAIEGFISPNTSNATVLTVERSRLVDGLDPGGTRTVASYQVLAMGHSLLVATGGQ